jgi:hypothetical protein
MERKCWCCDRPLYEWEERLNGACRECDLDARPAFDVTEAGQQVAMCIRGMDAILVLTNGAESEPEVWPHW